ncbi:MAG TPA: HAMP domain-containing sensor histidine kinase [Opitutaceae bacterium]|nr:HAMP domain-containing sensor histidine kinase [Opitutaceae bacterium]
MSLSAVPTAFGTKRFRFRLFVGIMVVVSAATVVVLWFTERRLAESFKEASRRSFQAELATWHHVQAVRQAGLIERCRTLVRRPRIHAAIEDDALDLLYPSAKDELRDLMAEGRGGAYSRPSGSSLEAHFYRFLDRNGAVIRPAFSLDAGLLTAREESQLALPGPITSQHVGYLARDQDRGGVTEVIAMPIFSTETGQSIASLVVGFKTTVLVGVEEGSATRRGLWVGGELFLPGSSVTEREELSRYLTQVTVSDDGRGKGLSTSVAGQPHLLFFQRLNPDSLSPPAYEVCVYPLTLLLLQQGQARWQILGVGGLLLLAGLGASAAVSRQLSEPVERLAVASEENQRRRVDAETALESTHVELQRAARFSADASHQLKTPVAVLRAGLEELRSRDELTPETKDEIAALIHQTYRLSSIIDDLLLLSRLDAGRLQLKLQPVNLRRLIEVALDDLGAQSEGDVLTIETEIPESLEVSGDDHYIGLILFNLLENARKYNRTHGRVLITARREDQVVVVGVGNTGEGIDPVSQGHIFERFHRGSRGETVPGYGLGLNLARELARLHKGDLILISSGGDWTLFELRLGRLPGGQGTQGRHPI